MPAVIPGTAPLLVPVYALLFGILALSMLETYVSEESRYVVVGGYLMMPFNIHAGL